MKFANVGADVVGLDVVGSDVGWVDGRLVVADAVGCSVGIAVVTTTAVFGSSGPGFFLFSDPYVIVAKTAAPKAMDPNTHKHQKNAARCFIVFGRSHMKCTLGGAYVVPYGSNINTAVYRAPARTRLNE